MKPLRNSIPAQKTSVVTITGGVNEQVANMELKAGELIQVWNYEEIDGQYHGARSAQGFERYDGSIALVEDPLNPGEYLEVHLASEVPVIQDVDGFLETAGDAARETRRAAIAAVPGTGPVLCAFWYHGTIWAVRADSTTPTVCNLYKAVYGTDPVTDVGGWDKVTQFPTDVPTVTPTVNPMTHTLCKFAKWPSSAPNTESVVLTFGGLYPAVLLHESAGLTRTVFVIEDDPAATPAGGGNLPNSPAVTTPTHPSAAAFFNNRLFLAYNETGGSASNGKPIGGDSGVRIRGGGHLFFSNLGLPTFEVITNYAGEYFFGSPIRNMVMTPGEALTVLMDKGIKILQRIDQPSEQTGWVDMVVKDFDDTINSYANTAINFLGTIIFSGNTGVQLLDAADTYGDFSVASLSRKVHQTFMANRSNLLCSIGHKEFNQYRLFYTGGDVIVLTFDVEKKVKGATFLDYGKSISYVDHGYDWDGNYRMILGDGTLGYVYIVHDNARSFDGSEISTMLQTSYYHYGSPTHWKIFHRFMFEISGWKGVRFYVKPSFDYSEDGIPTSAMKQVTFDRSPGAPYGTSSWAAFTWASASTVFRVPVYFRGTGTNCSVYVATSEKIHPPHVIHNFITTYEPGSYKL